MTGDRGSLRGVERGDWGLVGPAPAAKKGIPGEVFAEPPTRFGLDRVRRVRARGTH